MFLYREYTLARLPQYSLTPDPSHIQKLSTHKAENTEDLGNICPGAVRYPAMGSVGSVHNTGVSPAVTDALILLLKSMGLPIWGACQPGDMLVLVVPAKKSLEGVLNTAVIAEEMIDRLCNTDGVCVL